MRSSSPSVFINLRIKNINKKPNLNFEHMSPDLTHKKNLNPTTTKVV